MSAFAEVLAAVHHAADALYRVGDADLGAVSAAIRAGRVHVLTRTLPAGYDVPRRYANVVAADASALLTAYRAASDATATMVSHLDELAVAVQAPSRVLSAARAAIRVARRTGVRGAAGTCLRHLTGRSMAGPLRYCHPWERPGRHRQDQLNKSSAGCTGLTPFLSSAPRRSTGQRACWSRRRSAGPGNRSNLVHTRLTSQLGLRGLRLGWRLRTSWRARLRRCQGTQLRRWQRRCARPGLRLGCCDPPSPSTTGVVRA